MSIIIVVLIIFIGILSLVIGWQREQLQYYRASRAGAYKMLDETNAKLMEYRCPSDRTDQVLIVQLDPLTYWRKSKEHVRYQEKVAKELRDRGWDVDLLLHTHRRKRDTLCSLEAAGQVYLVPEIQAAVWPDDITELCIQANEFLNQLKQNLLTQKEGE